MPQVAPQPIERLSDHDIPSNVTLSQSVGWQDVEAEWRVLHEAACVLGVRGDSRLIAQGAVGAYGAAATIAKMVIAPEFQRQGLGLGMQRKWWLSLLALGSATNACEQKQEISGASSALAPLSASVAPALPVASLQSGPVASNEVSVPGLRVRTGTLARSSLWGFTELAVDLKRARLEIVRQPRGVPLNQLLPTGALAVVNGGYFETDFRPSTWVRNKGLDLAPKSDTSRGGVLAVQGERRFIGPFSGLAFNAELAVQSFPLIVEADGVPGIHRDDGKRAARTVACLVRGELRFVIIAAPRGDGPTLFETVALLRELPPSGFGCSSALNLDGGPSSGVWFAPNLPARQRLPVALVAYGIAVLPTP